MYPPKTTVQGLGLEVVRQWQTQKFVIAGVLISRPLSGKKQKDAQGKERAGVVSIQQQSGLISFRFAFPNHG
jgi:hypothetical protein